MHITVTNTHCLTSFLILLDYRIYITYQVSKLYSFVYLCQYIEKANENEVEKVLPFNLNGLLAWTLDFGVLYCKNVRNDTLKKEVITRRKRPAASVDFAQVSGLS